MILCSNPVASSHPSDPSPPQSGFGRISTSRCSYCKKLVTLKISLSDSRVKVREFSQLTVREVVVE